MAEARHRVAASGISLAQVPVGSRARVIELTNLPPSRRLQLQALGLAPGRSVWVRQQQPVAVVLCGHTEVALEAELARGVLVELTD